MQPILVTGAAGFIGGELVRALRGRGQRVLGVDSFDPFYPREVKRAHLDAVGLREGEDFFELDVLEEESLEPLMRACRVGAVAHLAARAGVRPSFEDPVGCMRVNAAGTAAVAQAARRAGVGRVLMASSSSVYGERAAGEPFREEDRERPPASPYAASKRAAELLLRVHAGKLAARVLAVRIFTAYGPWQRPDLAVHRFARQILAGEPVTVFGDGSMLRDFTFVDDLVDGLVRGLDWLESGEEAAWELVNLGSGAPVSVSDLVDELARALERPASWRYLPAPVGDVPVTHADVAKARRLLGWEPRTPLSEGLARFAAWLREVRGEAWHRSLAAPVASGTGPRGSAGNTP